MSERARRARWNIETSFCIAREIRVWDLSGEEEMSSTAPLAMHPFVDKMSCMMAAEATSFTWNQIEPMATIPAVLGLLSMVLALFWTEIHWGPPPQATSVTAVMPRLPLGALPSSKYKALLVCIVFPF